MSSTLDDDYIRWRGNLIKHFSNTTTNGIKNLSLYRTHTGLNGINYINDKLKPNRILDVGCGKNDFKGLLKNHYAIDLIDYRNHIPGVNGADEIIDVYDFYTQNKTQFDMVYCVGALNFGDEDDVCNMLQVFKDIVGKGNRIFGHVRPGQVLDDIRNIEQGYDHYPWTKSEVYRIAELMNLEVVNMEVENTNLAMMPDGDIALYTDFFNERFEQIGEESEGETLMDSSIKYHSRKDIRFLLNNEYNRRFDIHNYTEVDETGIRNRLHVEFIVK